MDFKDRRSPLLLGDIITRDVLQLTFTHSSIDIHILDPNEQRPVAWVLEPAVNLPDKIQGDDDRCGEKRLEEELCVRRSTDRGKHDIELRGQANEVEENAEPGTPDAELGLVGQPVDRMALHTPCLAEADVSQANGVVDAKVGDTCQGQEPVEQDATGGSLVGDRETSQEKLENDRGDRATLLVYIGEKFRRHCVHCKCLDRSCAGVGGAIGNNDDGDGAYGVED